jgi:hypothetical protein
VDKTISTIYKPNKYSVGKTEWQNERKDDRLSVSVQSYGGQEAWLRVTLDRDKK